MSGNPHPDDVGEGLLPDDLGEGKLPDDLGEGQHPDGAGDVAREGATSPFAEHQEPGPDAEADAEEMGGLEGDGSSDESDSEELDAERETREAALRQAALMALSCIPMGQAFATLREQRKAGNTIVPERVTQQDLESAAQSDPGTAAPAFAPADLSSLLPGPTFAPSRLSPMELPPPAFSHKPSLSPLRDSDAESHQPPQGQSPRDPGGLDDELPSPMGGGIGVGGASVSMGATVAELHALEARSHPSVLPGYSADQAGSKARMMATWHYNEATEDGGVAISFGDLESLNLASDASNSNFEQLYAALGAEAAAAEEEEAQEAEFLEGITEESPEELEEASGGGAEPAPPELVRQVSAKDAPEEEDEPPVPTPHVPAPAPPAPTPVAPIHTPVATSTGKTTSTGKAPSTGLPSSVASATGPGRLEGQQSRADEGPISKEMATVIKADLASTIRMELLKSVKPSKKESGLHSRTSSSTPPSAHETASTSSAKMNESAKKMDRTIKVGFVEGRIKPINIVMLIVGTRGDVQPFIGIGLKLKEYGHRVRIASHKVFREFVTGFGLEFYPIGGDPKVLSEFVVKHRGIMPGLNIADALEQREQVKQILYSSWGACVLPDPEHLDKPFIADAIVANPPAYGHTHCAEKLNVPLHIVFTMPWTPTKCFPNPFARIKTDIAGTLSKVREVMNWLSYFAVEDLAWLGMSGMVKDFRKRTLQLVDWDSKDNGSHTIYHSKVPVTYIWSPTLVERPSDWPHYCEVVGFINVELTKLTKYEPDKELAAFLAAGPPPVYIGFGSLVVGNPVQLTQSFMTAIKQTGMRAIIQKGWGGLGEGVKGKDHKNVFLLGPAPHDWLFERCCAVVHHGGAGTTACGLYCGKPTFIVPFFGDQPFWGAACFKAGVGPAAVAIDNLTTARIVEALKTLILPRCQKAALEVKAKMHAEDGINNTVDHLHRTIYGALLAGHVHKWMKQGASRAYVQVDSATDATDGQLRGSFLSNLFSRGTTSGSGPSQARLPSFIPPPPLPRVGISNSALAAEPSLGAGLAANGHAANEGRRSGAGICPPGREFSFGVATRDVGVRSASDGQSPSRPPATPQAQVVQVAEMPKRKSFLAFMGC
ncbi:hypothetical protein FOA52_001157 [Chlamydomonas sp. UWO 241]|nr:hypothetical protein FOA52_001157 [Chlamydomonas sp. UWO 241]